MSSERDDDADPRQWMEVRAHLQRRAGQLAKQYGVGEDPVREVVDRISAQPPFLQMGYVAGSSHALMITMSEEHAGCVEPGCRLCVLIADAIALILATDQADVDDRFKRLVDGLD
ncbi:hypothetical protein [Phytohabitans rumicis]|uniref:Uncharacterized protein n=1 Tax=Phytohabitans rumicis TaxID=1076125 RepID=A0A6V8KRA0_9ACTN|nr:hypothetical protein [Phytohabitans rumicis]GFJ86374.1 hypothetical protein Prum_000160 [Phytohabitans rumicis]